MKLAKWNFYSILRQSVFALLLLETVQGNSTQTAGNDKFYDCSDKGCLSLGDEDCHEDLRQCLAVLTFREENGKYVFTIVSKSNPGGKFYTAMGFSEDQSMGDDSVAACVYNGKGHPEVHRYYNNFKISSDFQGSQGIKVLSVKFEKNMMMCEFEQFSHQVKELDVDISKPNFYYLMSYGDVKGENTLVYHGASHRTFSGSKIKISETGIQGTGEIAGKSIRLHATFMIIAWALLSTPGIFFARFYKNTFTNCYMLNKPIWVIVHAATTISSCALTLVAFFIVYLERGFKLTDPNSLYVTLLHTGFGFFVVVLAPVQVLGGFIRPVPASRFRKAFDWFHYVVGFLVLFAAMISIATSNNLSYAVQSLPSNVYLSLIIVLLLFYLVIYIIMSWHVYSTELAMVEQGISLSAFVPGNERKNPSNQTVASFSSQSENGPATGSQAKSNQVSNVEAGAEESEINMGRMHDSDDDIFDKAVFPENSATRMAQDIRYRKNKMTLLRAFFGPLKRCTGTGEMPGRRFRQIVLASFIGCSVLLTASMCYYVWRAHSHSTH